MKRSHVIIPLLLLTLVQLVWADVPQMISYQGVLRNPSTDELYDGNYDLTFRLYDVETFGTPLWSEVHTLVPVDEGVFSVILGSTTTFSSQSVYFTEPYWLEIAVGATTLTPRTKLTAVPYSLNARAVTGSNNVFPDSGFVGIGTINPSTKLDVAGDANVQGNLSVTGTITQGFQTKYYSFGAHDVTNSTIWTNNYFEAYYDTMMHMGYSLNLCIPIHLPHGATIAGITINVDDHAAADATCKFYSMAITDFTLLESSLTPITTFSSSGTGQQQWSSTTLNTPVDNQSERFWLRITSGEPSVMGDTIRFYGGYIAYVVN